MVDSGFIQFKLDYKEIQNLAVGAFLVESIRTGEHLFYVYCSPRGFKKVDDGRPLDLHLSLVVVSRNTTNPIFEAFVVSKEGATYQSHAKRTTEIKTGDGVRFLMFHCFLKPSDLESLWAANGGVVTIVCGVIVPQDNPISVPAPDIGVHLRDMLGCTDGSDVSFSVGGETFHAHRALLAARSPVFKAELFGSMAEAQMPCITVQGIEPLIFKALLHFVYTDALPADQELGVSPIDIFQHLLAAADRYALDMLKLVSARKLWEIVPVDTVAVILTCAETYNCQELKNNCMDFFVAEKNFKGAMLTKGFGQLVLEFPSIIAELRKRAGI